MYQPHQGHLNARVVHMNNQRNAKNMCVFCLFVCLVFFFRLILENCDQGSKCLFSRKMVLFGFYLGAFQGYFSNSSVPPNMFRKRSCLGDKIGCKSCVKFSFMGVFLESINLDYEWLENLWPSQTCVQRQYSIRVPPSQEPAACFLQ